jgi:methyl-accepting chemotaxis protein
LPKLSIAAKLYAIFAALAMTTVALSLVAVHNARHHATLTAEFESANSGTWNVERVIGPIYAVQSAARGVVMSSDFETAGPYWPISATPATRSIRYHRLAARGSRRGFRHFQAVFHSSAFQNFTPELARIAQESGSQAARDWADKNFASDTRNELTQDLDALRKEYKEHARRT